MKKPIARLIIVGGLVVAGAGYLLYSSINSSMVYYYTVGEVLSGDSDFSGRGVRISGWVMPGTVKLAPGGKGLEFTTFDRDSGASMRVRYSGIVPDTFKEDGEVVVEGVWNAAGNEFEAAVLLAKCPSKYEGRGSAHPADLPMGKAGPQS